MLIVYKVFEGLTEGGVKIIFDNFIDNQLIVAVS